MNDDQLRAALAAADPAPRDLRPLPPELLEETMSAPVLDRPETAAPSRRPWLAAAAAAVLVAGGAATYVATTSDEPSGQLQLALPGGDPLAMSCLPVSAEGIAAQSLAFAGTATAVSATEVRLEVDQWYAGGDAGTVVLANAPEVQQALLGATEFEVGGEYLVSATDGTVSVCGLTGPATPELQALYDEAF